MNMPNKTFRSVVNLTAFGSEGILIAQESVSYDDYYGDTQTLIDDNKRIEKEEITVITGEIYNSHGEMQSCFTNFYDRNGEYVRSRAIHLDGTVLQD
jgi:hypothetical protein